MSRAKTTGLFVARLFGFRRAKPTTQLGKYVRNANRALRIVAWLYVALLIFPQVLFAYNVNAKGVTVYSRAPLPRETTTRIEEAMDLVSQSELAGPGRTERIFLCNNPWLYRLFYPIQKESLAICYPITGNIFVAEADLVHNVARSPAPVNNKRAFSSTAAHEITHDLIRHHLGVIRDVRLAKWVREGYPDYVARESSFPEEEGVRNLREGNEVSSGSFQYFVYREMVRHLAEDRHLSFDEIEKRSGDSVAVKAETVAALKGKVRQP